MVDHMFLFCEVIGSNSGTKKIVPSELTFIYCAEYLISIVIKPRIIVSVILPEAFKCVS